MSTSSSTPSGAASQGDDNRATLLATTVLKLFAAGRSEDAARALREAIALSPQNATVLSAFQEIQKSQNAPSAVVSLCQRLATDGDEKAGTEALKLLSGGVNVSGDSARQIVDLLLQEKERETKSRELCSKVLDAILKSSQDARIAMAKHIQDDGMSKVYKTTSGLGEEALDGLVTVTLDERSWNGIKDEKNKPGLCTDLFKLLSKDLEKSPLTVRPLSRLLSTETDILKSIVDSSILNKLLNLLSLSNPVETRTPALLAVAKYLETVEIEKAPKLLSDFVMQKLASNTDDDLVCAFSVAAALFPVVTAIASPLFLTEGFLPSIVPVLEKRGTKVQQAGLELLSASCVDKACRDSISKHCVQYLDRLVKGSSDGKEIAALILAKISGTSDETIPTGQETPKPNGPEAEKLADVFKNMMLKGDDASRQNSVEGLAYTSLTPAVKEKLIKDKAFLKSLIKSLGPATNTAYLFGSLTTLDNLSHYTKPVSEEQKKMSQLKNYANAQPTAKVAETDVLDKDPAVTSRCRILVDAGIVPALVNIGKKISPTAIFLICNILLSLSKTQQYRGVISQQGGVKLLIQLHASVASSTTSESRTPQDKEILQTAAHALARTLISVNPSLVFGASSLPLSSAISPLLTLIQSVHTSDAEYKDLLPIFEALLGLTNLASTTDPTREIIVRLGWPIIEELLLADNDMIQRADTELICNLMISPLGVAKFADGSGQAANRLHILLALADADDVSTRRAAGGAIAMLTEWDSAIEAIVKRERGVEILLQMAGEESEELMHRGVVAVRNIVMMGGEPAVNLVKAEEGEEIFKEVVQRTKREEILFPAVEVLKKLLG